MRPVLLSCLAAASLLPIDANAAPASQTIDVGQLSTQTDILRVLGSTGDGSFGVPVAGGADLNGDGDVDLAIAAFQAPVGGQSRVGSVFVVLGDGSGRGEIDTASAASENTQIQFVCSGAREVTRSQIWMDDITGDGIAELIIARQNFTPSAGAEGAGAVSIIVGGNALTLAAGAGQVVALDNPPSGMTVLTITGSAQTDRVGIWLRTGDVTGDGIADLVTAADQDDTRGDNAGAAYLIRGGSHLNTSATIDINNTATTALAGHVAQILPAAGSDNFHFGGTCQLADLDGNGRAEVIVAATLNRAGASVDAAGAPTGSAESSGGAPDGRVYIAWDPLFADQAGGVWPTPFVVETTAGSDMTQITGSSQNISFGEELLGGEDFDADGETDLFVGDLVSDFSGQNKPRSGSGHVLFSIADLRGQTVDLDTPPAGLRQTLIVGAATRNIAADTAMQGDFDGDGIADLAIGSPHDSPLGRVEAGAIDLLFGQSGGWPARIDLADLPEPSAIRIHSYFGANGTSGGDVGDVLMYSSASGDVDGDGRVDLIVNEMLGNGSAVQDVGTLVVLPGSLLGCKADLGDTCAGVITEDDPGTPTVGGDSGALRLQDVLMLLAVFGLSLCRSNRLRFAAAAPPRRRASAC